MRLSQFLANVVPNSVPEAYAVPSSEGLKLGPLALGAVAHGLMLDPRSVSQVVTAVIDFMLQRGIPPEEFCLFNEVWRAAVRSSPNPEEALKRSLAFLS